MSLTLSDLPETWVCAVAPSEGDSASPARNDMIEAGPTPPCGDRELVDARLMTRIAKRDRDALGELYDRFNGPLYATALRIVRDAAEAQDIVHDAFVTLWEKAAAFEPERGSAFAWVVTLVRNRAIDRVRSRRRRADLLADSAPDDLGYQEGSATTAGSDAAAFTDDARVVRAAVAKLPAEQRTALELAFFGGLTQEQVAEKLREPLGTVKARIRRGLLKLRDALAHRL